MHPRIPDRKKTHNEIPLYSMYHLIYNFDVMFKCRKDAYVHLYPILVFISQLYTTLHYTKVWINLIISLQKSDIAQEAAKVTTQSKCDSSINLNVPFGRSLSTIFSSSQGKSVHQYVRSNIKFMMYNCISSHSLYVNTTTTPS